jgi:ribosome-binding protein aMBF1 (putative translation factor)
MKRKADIGLVAEITKVGKYFDREHTIQSSGRETFLSAPENKAAVEKARLALDVAEKLCEARRRAGLTQTVLAQRIHTSQANIARIERGSNASIFTIAAYAGACGRHVKINLV